MSSDRRDIALLRWTDMVVKGAVKGYEEWKVTPASSGEPAPGLEQNQLNDMANQDVVALITSARNELGFDHSHLDSTSICE